MVEFSTCKDDTASKLLKMLPESYGEQVFERRTAFAEARGQATIPEEQYDKFMENRIKTVKLVTNS